MDVSKISAQRIATDDIDELFSWDAEGWESDFTQISSGPLGFTSKVVQLGGVTLMWCRHARSVRVIEHRDKGGFLLAFPLEGSSEIRWGRGRLSDNDAQLSRRGSVTDFLNRGPASIFSFDVDPSLHAELGWEFQNPESILPISPAAKKRLLRVCSQIAKKVDSGLFTQAAVLSARTRALNELRTALTPWLSPARRKTSRQIDSRLPDTPDTVRRFESLLVPELFDYEKEIGNLAKWAGTSKRSLYRLINEWAGIAPGKYIRIKQLHHFRSRLLKIGRENGAISQAARETGFDHLSRLAQHYSNHFGELPNETLKRKNPQ